MHALRSFQCFDWSVGLATMSFVWMHNPSLEKYNFLLVTYWYCSFSGWLPKQTFSSSFLIYRESLYQVSSFRTASTTITTNFNYNINTELKLLIIRLLPCFKHAQLSQCKCILSHSGEKKCTFEQTRCIHTSFLVNTQTPAWQPTIKRKRGFILVNKQHPAVFLSAQWEQCCRLIPLWSDEMKTAKMRHCVCVCVSLSEEKRDEIFWPSAVQISDPPF